MRIHTIRSLRNFPLLALLFLMLAGLPSQSTASLDLGIEPGIIQPGAEIEGGTTLSWLLLSIDDSYSHGEPVIYAITHAHGSHIPDEGEVLHLGSPNGDGIAVGEVVAKQHGDGDDWTLVRVFEESLEHVDFSLRYWSGPTGVPEPGRIQPTDTVCHYGYGQLFEFHSYTRPRCGELTRSDERLARFMGTIWAGDSGSPVFHYETGQAVGMIKSVQIEVNSLHICYLLERFADHGYNLELATAPYDPPPPRPALPAIPYHTPILFDQWDSQCFL